VLYNRDSTIYKCFRKSTLCTSQKNQFPVSCPNDRATPSGRPSVHCSIRPDARQTKHHLSGRRVFPSGPFTVSRSFYSSLHPSGRLSSSSERPSVFDQASDSFQIYIWEDCCNRPDDVDFRPDALLLKARIAIQIQPCGRLLAWSRRTFNRYGNCGFDFNRSDAYLSWSGHAKPFMEITCSGRATVWTTVSHRPDEALKKERFSVKISKILVAQLSIQTAHVRCPNGAHIFYCNRPFEPQPINRGPWALRIARIRY
jgi:hypothetical protein